MAYYFSRTLRIPYEEALQKILQNLQQQKFGVITTIDLKDTLKQKFGIAFRKYKILSACNPEFAYKAITLESHIGLVMPCNVIVQERENGEVEVSAITPLETIDQATSTSQLTAIANEVSRRLRAAIDGLGRIDHQQAIPKHYSQTPQRTCSPPMRRN